MTRLDAGSIARAQRSRRLVDHIGQTYIIACREDTTVLELALRRSGVVAEVLRQSPRPEYAGYSRSFLCLLNHRHAWELASRASQPTLIVEADFVPVKNFGNLPISFDPSNPDLGIAWLYTCAPQVYRILPGGYATGYSTAMVAYVISPRSARFLMQVADEIALNPGPREYTPWDSGLDYRLRDHGFVNYVPFRNYGEHGGIPNPEHRQNKLSPTHRADVLYGPLSFEPFYAREKGVGKPNPLRYLKGRLYGRVKGLGRLALGKYLRIPVLKSAERPLPLAWFALRRQLTFLP
ncbi:MAG: LPS biosynthesis glycosyltransferase [Leptolyngbyaceae cyanobacterium T60_A2020_046]|nr:LPS biosynthesis glycosyltransferase [Leptolyngbyaceae cyanobacterium T60_A2020_046]